MNIQFAPPPKTVDGLLAVPVDIQSVEAAFVFDAATSRATADATMSYTVGPTAGNPIFDLRQEIGRAWLDGTEIDAGRLAHRLFGSSPYTDLRVIQQEQQAGSAHTLRVQYGLTLPTSEPGGTYPPLLTWPAGGKLNFAFGFSDRFKARYAEAWLPANLIFDQFSTVLNVVLMNVQEPHAVITNGAAEPVSILSLPLPVPLPPAVGSLLAQRWVIRFPDRFTAASPLLEIRPSSTLLSQTDTVALPVSGRSVSIEALRFSGTASDSVVLRERITRIKGLLTTNEQNYGPFAHGDRFVALFTDPAPSGMEYDGGTTVAARTDLDSLRHEVFHSWFARGVKPASQADSWLDEAFTVFNDQGANTALPIDSARPPVQLCSRDPWQRHTPDDSYYAGHDLWKHLASLLGVPTVRMLMRDFYTLHAGDLGSTEMLEEFLVSRGGNAGVVGAFHRWVYGIGDSAPVPDLWIKDDPAHQGEDDWTGRPFWDSPDLWIRNDDDGDLMHEPPLPGRDNWFHARVRNRGGKAEHFVVTFHARGFLGTEFLYPADFLPCIAAKAQFDLEAHDERVVRALWPATLVPAAGSHTCVLASVITKTDAPTPGRHVWEHNNLAQKNLVIADLPANGSMVVPVVVSNGQGEPASMFELEAWTPEISVGMSVIHPTKELFERADVKVKPFKPVNGELTSEATDLIERRFRDGWEAEFRDAKAKVAINIPRFTRSVVGLKVTVPAEAKVGDSLKLDFVQRHAASGRITGGVAVQVNVTEPRKSD